MAPNPRVLKAFSAMKDLGIPAGTVKPVLKNLLKLYDKNWELIEEDNYRTLADAIFECADDKRREDKEKDAMEYDGSERPLKKLHLEQQEDQVSSTLDYANTIWDLEEGEVPQTSIVPKLVDSSQSCLRDKETESSSHSLLAAFLDKGNPISSELALKITKLSPNRASSTLYSNQERDGPDFDNMLPEKRRKDYCDEGFVVPKIKPSVGDVPHLAIPISIVHLALPGKLEGSSNGNSSIQCRRSLPGDCLPHIMGPNREAPNIGNSGRDLIINKANCSQSYISCKRSSQRISDIAKGTENVRISLLDETGNEQLPNFVYIPQNIIYQNAYIQFSLARIVDDDCCSSCLGDCLSLSVPCVCARDTGGEFAYNPQGLLKEEFLRACISMNEEPQNHFHFYCEDCPLERAKNGNKPEPCKGHLVRKFIKECWRKCGCDMQCGNRVVQRGITCKLQVFLTNEGKGWGVRTLQDLPKGAFVCEYIGEILTNMELYERNKQSSGNERHTYPVLLDADWSSEGVLKDEDALCLDATFYGNVARFINHRCFDANLLEIPVEVETPDHHYYHLAFFTKRKLDALEELTWDYGIDFDDHNHPIRAFQCCCGSAFCRDMRGKRTKSGAFRRPTTSGIEKPFASSFSQ